MKVKSVRRRFWRLCDRGDHGTALLGLGRNGTTHLLDVCRCSFAATFDENVSLQCVLARKALVAVTAWEWLDSEMDALVSLKVVISIEALRTLIASEWPVILRIWWLRVTVHGGHVRSMAAVEGWHHARRYGTAHQRELSIGVVHVGENRHGIAAVGPVLWVLWLRVGL